MEGKEDRLEGKEDRPEGKEDRPEGKEDRPARRPRARGVTLFEVLIVVTIIALISSGIGLAALEMKKHADHEQALTDGRTVLTGVEAFWALHGDARCPSVEEMMRDKLFRRDGRGRDPWGERWRIECTESEAVVNSNGPDRKPGTEDDIRIPPV